MCPPPPRPPLLWPDLQFDPLLDLMSAREQLAMFARLKGVPEPGLQQQVGGGGGAEQVGRQVNKWPDTTPSQGELCLIGCNTAAWNGV